MAWCVSFQPGGLGERLRRTDPHRPLARGRRDLWQGERLGRQVSGRDPPAAGDLQAGFGLQNQQRDVAEEQLSHLDRDALDCGFQVLLAAEHRNHLGEPGGPHQRAGHLLLGELETLAKAHQLGFKAGGRRDELARLGADHKARTATLELWTPLEPVVRANSPKVKKPQTDTS